MRSDTTVTGAGVLRWATAKMRSDAAVTRARLALEERLCDAREPVVEDDDEILAALLELAGRYARHVRYRNVDGESDGEVPVTASLDPATHRLWNWVRDNVPEEVHRGRDLVDVVIGLLRAETDPIRVTLTRAEYDELTHGNAVVHVLPGTARVSGPPRVIIRLGEEDPR